MGALDLAKIQGNIELRFGRNGETFLGLGANSQEELVTPDQVVYADQVNVLTWLWNHRDAAHACVPRDSNGPAYILLFADEAEKSCGDAEGAILQAMEKVGMIGGRWLMMDVLSSTRPEVTLDLTQLSEGTVDVTPECNLLRK